MDLERRLSKIDWAQVGTTLDAEGHAPLRALLSPDECAAIRALFADDAVFRNRIDMARHGFGSGAYGYFSEPLPSLVETLRMRLYPPAAAIARRWAQTLGADDEWPETLTALRARCAAFGQTKPTPLLLRYEAGDHNRLHQDIYGAIAFPLQLVILLSKPGEEFTGGELVFTEQKPRSQSRAHVAPMSQGDGVLFATRERPAMGARGPYRLAMRHGVATVRSGERFTLGVIFHDAA